MSLSTKARRLIAAAAIAAPALAIVAVPSARQTAWHLIAPRADAGAATVELEAVLADRKLHVAMPDGSVKTYAVAIGTRSYPTPTGSFTIRRIVWNPAWVPPDSPWARRERARGPSDPRNPMKVAKIFFREPDYYIHGTGHVGSLGTAASHGCLRMHPDEVAELGAVVMQAGGVSHDWDWVKRTLRLGRARTINLKHPVRIRVVSSRPESSLTPETADDAATDSGSSAGAGAVPDSGSAPTGDSGAPADTASSAAPTPSHD
jgi:hypothetical protein